MRTAVIMAAGLGTRFGSRTELMPKGFIDVGGVSMIKRSIKTLIDCGIQRIIIGTGYRKEMYEQLSIQFPEVQCVYSEYYATTNSMWTLWNCCEAIGYDDFILLESDLIFEEQAIVSLMECEQKDIMLCADVTKFQDSYFIEYDENNLLVNCSVKENELKICGELVGIHKISNNFYRKLYEYYSSIKVVKPKMGYEFAILNLAQNEKPIYVLKIQNLKWYEIDDDADLKYANEHIVKFL